MDMKTLLPVSILFLGLAWTCAWSQPDNPHLRAQDILLTSNDYLELVREYWPKIGTGNVQAMAIAFDALNNCSHFKSAIRSADNVDDLEELLSDRHPQDVVFAKGVFYKCKGLVDRYDEFPGWQRLRLRAALAGDLPSRIFMAFNYYRNRDTSPRAEVPFSPAEFLTGAMLAGDPTVFVMIALAPPQLRLRTDISKLTTIAWRLLECRFRGDCDEPTSLKEYCAYMVPECLEANNAHELWRLRAGTEAKYAEANRRAEHLFQKIRERSFEELGLDLVW